MGIITRRQITNFLTSFKLNMDSLITKAIIKEFKKVDINDPLKYLSKSFNRHTHVLVTSTENEYFVTTDRDLLDHFVKNN